MKKGSKIQSKITYCDVAVLIDCKANIRAYHRLTAGEEFFPAEINWVIVGCMVILGSVGYLLLITSLRLGELSAIMPFRYSRIVFLLIFGVLFFGESPSLSMLLGSALVIVSGIYLMWREHVVKQRVN